MTTDFNKKTVVTSGSIRPSTIDTPTDVRTRIETLDEVELIPLPYVGMIFYVISEDAYYSVKSLKKKDINGTNINKIVIDSYQKLIPEDEIIELRNMIKELTEMPEIVIANKNIDSEMEYLNEKTKDKNVVGIIIDPYFNSTVFTGKNNEFYIDIEFINNEFESFNTIEENKIGELNKAFIQLKESNIYNAEMTYLFLNYVNYNTSYYYDSWDAFTKTYTSGSKQSVLNVPCVNMERHDTNFTIEDTGKKLNGAEAAELLKKAYNEETQLKVNLIFYTEIIPTSPLTSYIKPLKITYSTKVFFKKD